VRLTQIFRQASHSGVVTNAHRINAGDYPRTQGLNDFFHFPVDDAEQAAQVTVDVVARRIPAKFSLDPRRDHSGADSHASRCCRRRCPEHLVTGGADPGQARRARTTVRRRIFRVGDKVTQIRNNYDKAPTGCSTPPKGLSQLTHAYAMSIHRSQGSEYPCVVVPITTSAWMMLQRNLLYTAVTRAKKLVVLVGSQKALGQAVRTVGAGRRHTTLDYRLSHQQP
jgi:exodeoxyribonuclease V alpha subunit